MFVVAAPSLRIERFSHEIVAWYLCTLRNKLKFCLCYQWIICFMLSSSLRKIFPAWMDLAFTFRITFRKKGKLSLEFPDFMYFRLSILHSVSYVFFLYCSHFSQDCSILEITSDSIERALCPSICEYLCLRWFLCTPRHVA